MTGSALHDPPTGGTAVAHRETPAGDMTIPADLSPQALIYAGIQRGLTPEALEKLVGLQERMEKRQAEKDFIAALAEFKRLCPSIKKNRTANIKTDGGGSYSYTYAELDEIARIADPILEGLGFSYIWNTEATEKSVRVECILSHRNGHSIRSFFTVPVESKSGMSPQQKFGAASTFAQRRSFANVLGLTTTDKDTDAAAVDPTKIGEDQATEIADLIRGLRGDQEKRFLAYMKVEKIADIRAADYKKAIASLGRVREANEKADAKQGGAQ